HASAAQYHAEGVSSRIAGWPRCVGLIDTCTFGGVAAFLHRKTKKSSADDDTASVAESAMTPPSSPAGVSTDFGAEPPRAPQPTDPRICLLCKLPGDRDSLPSSHPLREGRLLFVRDHRA